MKIFLIGFMGCGKTHWGKEIAGRLNIPFFDLDARIEESDGRPITTIFEEEGEEFFRLKEKEVLHLLTESHERFVMATGGGTPCFYNNIDYLRAQGTVVWINCSTDCLYQRLLKEKEKRPLIREIPDAELRSYIVKKYAARKIYYTKASVILAEDQLDLDTIISRIFHSNQ